MGHRLVNDNGGGVMVMFDSGCFEGDMRVGKYLAASQHAQKRLRELLSVPAPTPGLTEEQAEVARIEVALEKALDGFADYFICVWPHKMESRWSYVIHGLPKGELPDCWGATRLEAARRALARVNALRAEAARKRLPAPEEMTQYEREDELHQRGWEHVWAGSDDAHHRRPMWYEARGDVNQRYTWPQEGEPWEVSTCRALRKARRRDDNV